jgi:hypothetical protein
MDWIAIDKSPVTGATLWVHRDGTQVAASEADEWPSDGSAWLSGVSPESRAWVTMQYYAQYYA